jgi:hypothetical protein
VGATKHVVEHRGMRHRHPRIHKLTLTGWQGWVIVTWGLLAYTVLIGAVIVATLHAPPPD